MKIQKIKSLIQLKLKHAGFQKYLKNTSWLFGGQMLRMVLGLFVSVAVARYLGPEDFGLYNYILSVVALVGVLGQLGLKNIAKRELVQNPERKDEILGTCFVLNAAAGISLYVLLLLGLTLNGAGEAPERLGLYTLLGASLLLLPAQNIETWFQAQVRAKLSVVASMITLLVFAALKIAAIALGLPLLGFAYIHTRGHHLGAIKWYFYHRHYGSVFLVHFHAIVSATTQRVVAGDSVRVRDHRVYADRPDHAG